MSILMKHTVVLTALLVLMGSSQVAAQMPAPAPSPFRITVDAATFSGLPRLTVAATDDHGNTGTYGGVSLHDVLVRAGAPAGNALRGRALMTYVVVGASDGYHVLFALPELDTSFTDHVVLIADTRDGKPLPPNEGPYRLVVPFEKRGARWVRQVTEIDLENASSP
jgi:DMSO/TMAO reductase YedYZ molybdopterin-dependent catalytic subunit